MKIIRFFIYLFLFSFLPIHAEYFQKIGLNDGLTQPSIMSICQDELGRMWFGTMEGINVFDGVKVTPYKGWVPSKDSLIWLGNEVSDIVSEKSGDLYFMSDFNLMKYDLRSETFHRLSYDGTTQGLTSYEGRIWYMKNDSIFKLDPDTHSSSFYIQTQFPLDVNDFQVTAEKIFIGPHKGLYVIDIQNQQHKNLLDGIEVHYMFESSRKELWIGTRRHGMYWMEPHGSLHKVPFSSNPSKGVKSHQIRQFIEDDDHNVWFGSFDGLHKFDIKTHEYRLIQIPENIGGLTHSSIYSLYKDKQGVIWVGTYWGGVNYCDPKNNNFVFYNYDLTARGNLYYSYLGDMVLDKDDNIWICTDGGGISCMNDKWEVVHSFTAEQKNSILHNNVKGIAYDREHDAMYIATYLGGLSRYDMRTGRFFNYLTDYDQNKTSPGSIVNFIKVRNGNVYMMTDDGFYVLDIATQIFQKIDLPADLRLGFDVDENNNLYVIGWNCFAYLNLSSPRDITRVSLENKGCKSVLTNILCRDNGIILSSLGSGMFYYSLKNKQTTHYTSENNNLHSNYCYNVCLTSEGNVLISTDKGVTYYNPRIDKFSTVDFQYYFPNTHIIHDCGLLSGSDGTVFVGTTEGLVTFKEKEFHKIRPQVTPPDFYFSQLEVESQRITPNDETGILSVAMPFTDAIELASDQQNINISYATSDYELNLTGRSFKYKMEGLDGNWIKTMDRTVHYANLQPGKYTLHVALLDYDKIIKEIQLSIYIATPWYNTWIAWLIYVFTIGMVTRVIVLSRMAKRELSLKLENERKEKAQIEQLNHEKLVFFTNVSHEFRTPLTLLISHVDILLQKHSFSPTIYNQILKIRKNAEQMNNLISELLEFRKLTQNHHKLKVMQQDMGAFLKEGFLPFVDYASQRNIVYENQFPIEPVSCWFDSNLMAKVVLNLLSNAFKYTPDGGQITLKGRATPEEVIFSVKDTGVGLTEKDVSQIFIRFYQGENQQKNNVNSPGTGIGLALCKAIIERHHGDISVKSQVGEGSEFTVRLKRTSEVFRKDPNVEIVDSVQEKSYLIDSLPVMMQDELKSPEEIIQQVSGEEIEEKKRCVLLVEDNVELLQILQDLFAPFYQVFTATNGEEGLQKVYEQKVDLIVSDIMMPKMSGTEMCLQLKNNIDYCHIPIILLTALDSTEQNIEGLSRGADDYVTKPFHAGLLLARANNLIRSRLLMQHQFNKKPMSEIDLTSINPLDQDLLKKVTSIIEAHIDDPLFDIPALCQELGVCRSLIYAKFKALTGMTPNNFVLNFRLKFAATLLKQYPNMSISEVSDRSGFNSPVYFSQCFKKQFGVTPHVYKKENQLKTGD